MKPKGLAITLLLFIQLVYCKAVLADTPDTNSIIVLNQKAWKTRSNDIEQAKNYAFEAIKAACRINYQRGLSNSFNVLGYYYKVKGHYDSAEINYNRSLAIRKKLHDTLKMAISYRNLMSIDKLLGKYKRAIQTGLLALQLLDAKGAGSDVLTEKGWLKMNMAALYSKTGEYDKAVRFAADGKNLFKMEQDEEGLAAAALTLGGIYEDQKQYDKALREFNFCITTFSASNNQKELAKAYNNVANIHDEQGNYLLALTEYKKSLEIRIDNGFSDDIKKSLHNIGYIYERFGKIDSANYYYNQSLALSLKSGDIEIQYESYRSLGNILILQKEYKKALWYLLHALYLSTTSSSLPQKIVLLKEISDTYRSGGKNDSALIYNDAYLHLNDSLNQRLTNSIILESNLKEKEYALTISEEKNKKQSIIIISILIVLALILIIFLMYYLATRAKKRELQLKQIIKEKELLALDAMLEGQEEERKRLATELHDTIGSILVATKYAFNAMEYSMEKLLEENKIQCKKIDGMLDEAMESVRRISHNMIEGIFTEKGLEGALRELSEMFEKTGKIKFNLEMYGFDRRMEYKIESNLYRIIQELLTNIIKHSQAKNVNIQLLKSKENINLVVEDDGRGFNPNDSYLKKGIGISNIHARVKNLSGSLNIDSGKGKGTTIVIDIPLNNDIAIYESTGG